jgi:hypothetical protein
MLNISAKSLPFAKIFKDMNQWPREEMLLEKPELAKLMRLYL